MPNEIYHVMVARARHRCKDGGPVTAENDESTDGWEAMVFDYNSKALARHLRVCLRCHAELPDPSDIIRSL